MIYRLVWGMEAARVFEAAQDNPNATTLTGTAVTAIETGTFSRAASILIRSGFDHRLAAISAVTGTGAAFDSASGMRQWISDLDPDTRIQPRLADARITVSVGGIRIIVRRHGARVDGSARPRTWTTSPGTTQYRIQELGFA